MSTKIDTALLQQIPLFSVLAPHHLQVLAFVAEERIVPSGDFLFKAGEMTGKAYLIVSGTAQISTQEGGELVAFAETGSFLGEFSLLAKTPYPFTVQGTTQCVVREFTNALLLKLCQEFPEAGPLILNLLSERLEEYIQRLDGLAPLFSSPASEFSFPQMRAPLAEDQLFL